jgi:hypothetical protein
LIFLWLPLGGRIGQGRISGILPDEKLELAGLKHYVYYWSQNFYYPYAISIEEIINNDLQFNNATFQLLAERTFYNSGEGVSIAIGIIILQPNLLTITLDLN